MKDLMEVLSGYSDIDWISFYEGLDDSQEEQFLSTLDELGLLKHDLNRGLR
ncbi:hypothetical protein HOG17_00190 [Candidatus Peregrinibacteria bacterium]|jgi:hypothetical protein|nr:hypothetical protein [Candidatus Peregrinibacteria bacterium]MBT4147680.1 hypothetical protein [Candidatus Peregrinibacteria bacterium]MBT4365959.1 hypothetical protein [Candidatus Peregrinibacteria bacterium]MBT4455808.1 hypothetical protein [Candidatus Peregrinibacteria bacterium]